MQQERKITSGFILSVDGIFVVVVQRQVNEADLFHVKVGQFRIDPDSLSLNPRTRRVLCRIVTKGITLNSVG